MKSLTKIAKKAKSTKPTPKTQECIICAKPTTRLVDGEPSCDAHAALVYENQVEDYTLEHLSDREETKA